MRRVERKRGIAHRVPARGVGKQRARGLQQSASASATRSAAPAATALSVASRKLNVCGPTIVGVPMAIGSIRFCPPKRQQAAADEGHVRRRAVAAHFSQRVAQHERNVGRHGEVVAAPDERDAPRAQQFGDRIEALRVARHDDGQRLRRQRAPRQRVQQQRFLAVARRRGEKHRPRFAEATGAVRGPAPPIPAGSATSNFRLPVTATSRAPTATSRAASPAVCAATPESEANIGCVSAEKRA